MRSRLFGNGYAYLLQSNQPTVEISQASIEQHRTRSIARHLNLHLILTNICQIWGALMKLFHSNPVYNELPFKVVRRPSCYIVLLHLTPVAAVVVIVSFNLYGYWIGKELSGVYNQDAAKELSLQLTAKLHELLMLASLSEVLLTRLLNSLALGCGLPFASLMAVNKFQTLSYIWSEDFRAMCAVAYPRRLLLVPLLLTCTMLGLVVGPSSAAALIPRLDTWPAGTATMSLNTSSDLLWPSYLRAANSDTSSCNSPGLGCFDPLAWSSVAANVFSSWGEITLGTSSVLPNHISMPGIASSRSMDIRVMGSLNPAEPTLTVASVQHGVMADMINNFRFLTFPSRSRKCKKTWSSAMCSYQDVSWFVVAMQPVVFAACGERLSNSSLVNFPVIDHATATLNTTSVIVTDSFSTKNITQFIWVNPNETQPAQSFIGVIVGPGLADHGSDFVCSIQAQWTKSTISASFVSTKDVIKSVTPGFDYGTFIANEYQGRTATIDPEWAQQAIESPITPGGNVTAFEQFLQLGSTTSDLSTKLETALAVLFAEQMAHSGSGAIPLTISSKDLNLKTYGDLTTNRTATVPSNGNRKDFTLQTSMSGYGYGLYTMSGLSASTLASIIILLLYSIVALVHLVSLYVTGDPYIKSWSEDRDVLLTCLQTRYRSDPWRDNVSGGGDDDDESARLLKEIVVFADREGRAEIVFRRKNWPEGT